VIDYWLLTKEFKAGDTVQRVNPAGGFALSPFAGKVTAVHRGLGVIDVQWPYGNERMFPDDLIRVDPKITGVLPPSFDQSYSSWDQTNRTAAAKNWRTTEVPPGFHQDLAKLWSRSASEVGAYDELYRRYVAAGADDMAIRDEVTKFYLVGRNLAELRLQSHAHKSAAYWAASNRQYRVTSQEFSKRTPGCPKCATPMRKTTYKMAEGNRVRLFACPKDLFLVRQNDLVGPGGEPVEW
jgi:hypothetical protein